MTEIIPKIQNAVMDDIKSGLKRYTEVVKANLKDSRDRLDSFSKQLEDTNKAEEAIEITKNIENFYNENIKNFNKSLDEVKEELM